MLRNLGLVIFGIAALAIGSYGYLWFQIKAGTDQIVQAMAPFAKIEFEGTSVSLDGEMRWKKIKVQSRVNNGELSIDEILVKLPDIQAIWDFKKSLEKNELPKTARLTITGLNLPFDNDFYGFIEEMEKASPNPYDFRIAGCGEVKRIGRYDLEAMGYTSRTIDLDLSYQFEDYSGVLTYTGALVTREENGYEFEADLETGMSSLSAIQAMGIEPKFKRFEMRYNDLGFQDRLNDYCAYKADIDTKAWLEHHVASLEKHFNFYRIQVGPKITAAYADYLTQGGQLGIVIDMEEDSFNPFGLSTYDAQEVIDWLKPEVTIGTRKLSREQMDISWEPGMLPRINYISFINDENGTAATNVTEQAPELYQEPEFRPTPINDLSKMIGRNAKIKERDGETKVGKIVNVFKDKVELSRSLGGGSYSIFVFKKDISTAEVFR